MSSKRAGFEARNSSVQAALAAAQGAASGKGKSAATGKGAPLERAVGLTVRLDSSTHEQLRSIAFKKRVSIHSLLLEGVDLVLRKQSN